MELSASAKLGDFDFVVTGRIPRLSTDQPISFVLILELKGDLDSLNPTDFLKKLTSDGYVFSDGEIPYTRIG